MTTATKLRWYMHRVRAMSPIEVGHRVAEKCRHATQDGFLRRVSAVAWNGKVSSYPPLPDAAEAPPQLRAQLAQDTAEISAGRWLLFGWQQVKVSTPPMWHSDPVAGIATDASKLSHRLNHRQLPRGADARRIWEINRWAEMTRLGMHGWVNNDLRAVELAQRWLADWCDINPTGHGINWTSPLEAAIRLINFTWFDALARACGAAEAQGKLAARIVPAHASWIWRHRSFGSSANNHLLGELAALVIAASRWPAVADLACTADAAWRALSAEILKQFAPDGSTREQALHYHFFAWELAWQAAAAIGIQSGKVCDRLLHAAEFFSDMSVAEGWDFGDSDDAQVLPLTLNRARAGVEWKRWLQGECETLHFWLGEPLLRHAPMQGWTVYSDAGMATRSIGGWHLRLDASPLGFGALAAHGHCDALHLSVWDGAQPLLIDPGTGGYFGMAETRAHLASWEAHNGPQPLRGFATPQRIGVFLQVRHHEAPTLAADGTAATATFCHEDHEFTRRVAVEDNAISIKDGEKSNRPFRVRWQLPPAVDVEIAEAPNALILRCGADQWLMHFECSTDSLTSGSALVSSAYGRMESATFIEVTAQGGFLRTMIRRHDG